VVYDTVEAAPVNDWCAQLHRDSPLDLPGDAGTLSFSSQAQDSVRLAVRFRQGGERFGRSPSRSLKTFLQTLRVLPWRRGQVPLVYCGDELVAVGDWWQSPRLEGDLAWRCPARFRAETEVSLRNRTARS
jgi:tRNA(Ile)-lysidine synthase